MTSGTDFGGGDVDRLFDGWFDGTLSAAEQDELFGWLKSDPAAARRFAAAARLHDRLRDLARRGAIVGEGRQPALAPVSERKGPATMRKPDAGVRRRWWIAGVAAAAALAGAVLLWVWFACRPAGTDTVAVPRPPIPGRPNVVPPDDEATVDQGLARLLAAGWRVAPAAGARFTLPAPGRVVLTRGELRVTSTAVATRTPLVIETALGAAIAEGTDFFIGSHETAAGPPPAAKGAIMYRRITRVLVLAGVVSLANSLGSVRGGAGELLAAEPDKAPEKVAVRATTDFAVDLYKRLAAGNAGRNVFFSPYSVSAALSMVAEGARGPTAEEMGRVLRFPEAARRTGTEAQFLPWNTSLIHTGMKDLHDRFNDTNRDAVSKQRIAELESELARLEAEVRRFDTARKEDAEKFRKAGHDRETVAELLEREKDPKRRSDLRTANALWAAKDFPIRAEFVDVVKQHYGTGAARNLDFAGDPVGAAKEINGWCARQTNNRVAGIVSPDYFAGKDIRMMLTNAVYFRGCWAKPFESWRTFKEHFHTAADRTVETRLMHDPEKTPARYAAFDKDGRLFPTPAMVREDEDRSRHHPGAGGVQVLDLPYNGGDVAMTLVVPSSIDGLAEIENGLTSGRLAAWTAALKPRTAEVYLPKFRVETSYGLRGTLAAMGMPTVFSKDAADLSGLSSADRLFVDEVFHKAFVVADEEGTEAAAVTAPAKGRKDGPHAKEIPFIPTVRADRPFLFLIRDLKTGTILFMGRVSNPA